MNGSYPRAAIRAPIHAFTSLGSLWYSTKSLAAKRYRWVNPSVILVSDKDWVLSTISGYIGHYLGGNYNFGLPLLGRVFATRLCISCLRLAISEESCTRGFTLPIVR